MRLADHAPTDIDVTIRRLGAMEADLKIAFKECGPRLFTPNPTIGVRTFVIAAESTVLPKGMCSKFGPVHPSALKETISEEELDELIRVLNEQGYRLTKHEKGGDDIDGHWISFQTTYRNGDTK